LRGEVEGDGEAGLAFAQKIAVALIGFDGGAEAGILAHGPQTAAVHGGINAAGKREFARIAESRFGVPAGEILFGVEAINGKTGERGESLFALGGSGGLGLGVRHGSRKIENGTSERVLYKARAQAEKPRSQPAGPAERSHRKKQKQQSDRDGESDEPACNVAGPGAQRGVEPAKSEDSKDRGNGFVKKLAEGTPEAAETALLLWRGGCAGCRRHKSILAQNRADIRKRGRYGPHSRLENLNQGTVNGLETTE